MKTYLIKLNLFLKRSLLSKKSAGKKSPNDLIERKWWMGDDLFVDQKPFLINAREVKNIS